MQGQKTTTAQAKIMAGQNDNHDLMANYVGKQSSPRKTTGDTRGFISDCKFCERSHRNKRNVETKRVAQPSADIVLIVVRETILLRSAA